MVTTYTKSNNSSHWPRNRRLNKRGKWLWKEHHSRDDGSADVKSLPFFVIVNYFELDVISYQPREGALRDNYNNYYLTRVVIERASFAHSLVLRFVCTMTMWLWISDGDDKNDWDHAIYVDDLYRIAWWWFLIVKLPLVRLLKVKNLLPEDRLRGRFQTESQSEGSILIMLMARSTAAGLCSYPLY